MFCFVYKYPLYVILFYSILFSSISKADVLVQQSDKPDGVKRGENVYVQFVSVLSVLSCPLSPVFLSLTYLSSPRTVGRDIVTAALNTTLLYSGERERERERGRAVRVGV